MRIILAVLFLAWLAPTSAGAQTYLYVVDVGPNRAGPYQVIRYDADGSNPLVFINQQLNRPQDIVFLEEQGVALVSSLGSNRITRHDAETGAYIDDFAAGLGQPTRMEFGADGLLYVLQWAGNGRVLRYDREGNFVDEFTDVGVSNSIGLDWDTGGNLYVSSWNGGSVRRFDPGGNDLGLFANTNLQGPTNLWFDASGDLLVMDWTGNAIRRFDAGGTFLSTMVFGLSQPEGVEFLDNGEFLVGNGGTSSVRRYDSAGAYLGDLVPPGLGGLALPNALRFRTLSSFAINQGLNDAWFNPLTNGQGFFIIVFEDIPLVFLAWFTYDTERPPEDVEAILGDPGHRWITAQGGFAGDTAELAVVFTRGGVFDAGEPAPENEIDGSMTVTFESCAAGTVAYDIPSLGLMGEVPIQRIANDNVALCESLAQP